MPCHMKCSCQACILSTAYVSIKPALIDKDNKPITSSILGYLDFYKYKGIENLKTVKAPIIKDDILFQIQKDLNDIKKVLGIK